MKVITDPLIELSYLIQDYGAVAVMGANGLGLGDMRRMRYARALIAALQKREAYRRAGISDLEFEVANPHAAALIERAEEIEAMNAGT